MKKIIWLPILTLIFINCQSENRNPRVCQTCGTIPKAVEGTKKSITKRYDVQDDKEVLTRTDIKDYDQSGNRIELAAYSPDSSTYVKTSYRYDSNDNQTSLVIYKRDGSMKDSIAYKYDSANNNIERTFWDSNDSLTHKYLYKYENNNLIKMTNERGTFKVENYYEYDAKGRKTLTTTFKNGKLVYKEITKYEDY